uniref:Uncharacterized protein n=1 Tax=Globodera rostochiensis TaxID=31243 RepID=A0A914GUY4_GLORO
MSFNFVVVVLLALVVAGCAAENVLSLNLKPCLNGGDYAYRVSVHCANRTATDGHNANMQSNELLQQNAYKYDIAEEKCPAQRYALYVRIINTKYPDFSIWPGDFVKTLTMKQGSNSHQLTFGNFFKIVILPKLEENSKMFYRLNVYCAAAAAAGGSDRHQPAEFKTFTKFDTLVVFNMEQRKCEQYSVNVWPVHQDWMDRHEMFNQPALVRGGIGVANGATQAIYFQTEFKLAIAPPLAPNSGKVYYVEAKCHDREAQMYRTYTAEANATQIVLNAIECTAYDISVWKLDNHLMQNALMKLVPNDQKNKVESKAVKIVRNSVYNFMYLPNSADKKLKRLPFHHMDDDAVNPMVTTKQQKLGQTSASNINQNQQQQQQKLAQTLTNFQSQIAEATQQQNNKIDALQRQIAEINQLYDKKLEQTLTKVQSEISKIMKHEEKNISTKIDELRIEMEVTNEQDEKEILNKLDALQTEIAQIKQNDAIKFVQMFTHLQNELSSLKKADENQLEQSLTNFRNELEEIKQREAEKWKKMTTLINTLLDGVAEIKQLEQKKLMQLPAQIDEIRNEINLKFDQLSINKAEVRQEIAATKQENMEKCEQISTHLDCLRTEIAGIKQKEDDELGGQMFANIAQFMHEFKQTKNEHGEIKRDLNEIRTTIFEIKEFLETEKSNGTNAAALSPSAAHKVTAQSGKSALDATMPKRAKSRRPFSLQVCADGNALLQAVGRHRCAALHFFDDRPSQTMIARAFLSMNKLMTSDSRPLGPCAQWPCVLLDNLANELDERLTSNQSASL